MFPSVFVLLLSFVAFTFCDDPAIELVVYPRVYDTDGTGLVRNVDKVLEINTDWIIDLEKSNNLLLRHQLRSEWLDVNDHPYLQDISPCSHHKGTLRGRQPSWAAVTICGSYVNGYMGFENAGFTIEPLQNNVTNNAHIIKGVKRSRERRSTDVKWRSFNLTGDTLDMDSPFDLQEERAEEQQSLIRTTPASQVEITKRKHVKTWRREQIDNEIGYFYDTAWEKSPVIPAHGHGTVHSEKVPRKWLKVAVGVDHTVVSFHGKDMVEKYVLALMNIVNAIYQDPSLDANMQLVITKLLFYEHKRQGMVKPGNAKKSLENVNSWNRRLHTSLAPGETHHDVAVWLTRSDIGGPSGYAPIAGACDPKRSCALNRDEGLTSAFIIAHEMAHILGLSHDGDSKALNSCSDEALEGSVMAPLVSATFHKFSWSKCSQREFLQNSAKWTCLSTKPPHSGEIVLNFTLQNAFSMDEQCRMEFGEGYSLCRAFDIIEPCSHLWCGHDKSPLVCKTKKGPPLEGTECGLNKWCINGYCEDIDVSRFGMDPVVHNPQDGGWSVWGPWGTCSRSCGTGVSFRTRKCDNPPPLHGGSDCFGLGEEWKICNHKPCPEPMGDIRAEQCEKLPRLLGLQNTSAQSTTWLPHESEQADMKCKLICTSQETRELHVTDENLIDGTPCSYENSSNICIQGTCQPLGCDGKLLSSLKVDSCGTCGGNNTGCIKMETARRKKIRREVSRMTVFPRLSREIRFEANSSMDLLIDAPVAFILKNRRRKKYTVTIPSIRFHSEIVEGTKFYYRKYRNRHSIWAKGPVLAEIVVLVYAPSRIIDLGINMSVRAEYYIHNDSLTAAKRYTWIIGGWGPCSASCGGGRRHRTVACWDTQHENIVRKKHCSLATKPSLPSEKCNNFSCNFQWIAGEWEPCTATCGSKGVQSRELYCVPHSVLNIVVYSNNDSVLQEPWRFMVAPSKCPDGMKPQQLRACNRVACPVYWVYSNWTQCSVSCGTGISVRTSYCPAPSDETLFTCGEGPLIQKKQCRGAFSRYTNPLCRRKKQRPCRGDQSKYCFLDLLSKYCILSGFRRICCKSCSIHRLAQLTS